MDWGDTEATSVQEVALPPPTNLTATAVSPTQIDLAWDPSAGATLYIIYRGFAPGTATSYTTSSAATSTFQAKQLQPNTLYCWQVANVNNMNERSARSNEACATTGQVVAVPPPTNVIATAISDTRINVQWDAVPGALKYFVNRSTSGGPFARITSVAAPQTTFQDVNLTPSTTYAYTIETVMPDNSTSAPSSPPAEATTFGLDLEGYWKFNSASGSTATDSSGYNRHGTLSGGATFSNIAAPIDEKMNYSANITSAASAVVTVPNTSVFNMSGSFSLVMWVNPQAAGNLSIIGKRAAGCGAVGWELAQDASGLVFRNPTSSVSFGTTLAVGAWTHIGVTHTAGTMNLYINGAPVASGAYATASFAALPMTMGHVGGCAGSAAYIDETQIYSRVLSAAEIQVLGERPPAPLNLTAAQRTSTSQELDWDDVASVQRYIVWIGTASGATQLYTSVPPTSSFIADHLQPNTTYYWQVQAVRNNLISLTSNETSQITFPAPNPPSNLTATPVSSTRINLAWTAEPRAIKYFINMSTNGGPFVRRTSTTSTTIQIVNLTPATNYAFTVETFDTGFLTSAPSAPVSAMTLP